MNTVIAATVCFLTAGTALAQQATLSNEPAQVTRSAGQSAAAPAGAPASERSAPRLEAPAPVAFGSPGSRWITIGGGAAKDFSDSLDGNLHGAFGWFVAQDVELSAELGGWWLSRNGDDELGINPAFIFRYHFVNTGDWTAYADIGIGLMFSTGDVPEDGTSVNFAPRAGVGATRQLTGEGLRLQMGVRWAHISNARIEGEKNNPSRDSVMLYAGLIFPF